MPKVGTQEFPYTRDGIAAAKATASATGQKVKARRGYRDVAHAQSRRANAKKQAFGGKQAPPFAKGQRSVPGRGATLDPADATDGTLSGVPQRGKPNSGTTFVPGERKPPPKAGRRVKVLRKKRAKT